MGTTLQNKKSVGISRIICGDFSVAPHATRDRLQGLTCGILIAYHRVMNDHIVNLKLFTKKRYAVRINIHWRVIRLHMRRARLPKLLLLSARCSTSDVAGARIRFISSSNTDNRLKTVCVDICYPYVVADASRYSE